MSEYRACVGAALFDCHGRVLVAHRIGMPPGPGTWQMPQGGIDTGEMPEAAVMRELREEIGTNHVVIIGEHPEELIYDFPADIAATVLGGRYRGQRQRWFALRFEGYDRDIRLDQEPKPEFDAWRWASLDEAVDLVVAFKQPIYRKIATSFAQFATPVPKPIR